jgi:microsomal dipeptidase-like Zn-dependent dipeptidase
VAYANSYRIFGTGQPQDGAVVANTAATFSNLGEGSYSWQVTADYGGAYAAGGLPTVNITLPKIIVGLADTHTHPFANLAAGGRLFWGEAFGPLPAVLSICEPWHGFGGLSDFLGNIRRTMNGNISVGHHTGGYPNFDGWPAWNTLDHQQMHADWIYRAYQGGLRLLVSHAVNNGLVCSIVPKAPNRTCDDMEAADLQIDAAKNMQFYTDMQSGGVGKGWFRIAYTPQEARNIIADGKLAVVLGIEVDKLFGCGKDECDAATVDAQLDKYYAKGVRHLYPLHFADNAFGGYALGGGSDRTLFDINSMAANKGGVWSFNPPTAENCSPSFAQPCNQRGLTALGTHLITSMMNRGMIIDIDHMGKRTTDSVFALAAARHYPIISGHTGFVETALPGHSSERDKSPTWMAAMKQDGGMVSVGLTPGESKQYVPSWRSLIINDCPRTSKTFVQSYLYAVDKMGGPDSAAVGVASDQFLNELLGPRFDNHCAGQSGLVFYPIVTRTGVTLQQSQAGNRTFDYNTEGLAQYGLLPEFIQDLKNEGLTDRDLNPLFRSAEGYIELWERAVATIPVP